MQTRSVLAIIVGIVGISLLLGSKYVADAGVRYRDAVLPQEARREPHDDPGPFTRLVAVMLGLGLIGFSVIVFLSS